MNKRVKKKDHENLSAANLERVKSLLTPTDGSKPITKKEACEILNISYNTTRLTRLLEDYEEQKAFVALRKSQNRGKPATDNEIKEAVTEYLQGASVSDIAKSLFRSTGFVKTLLEKVGVPERAVNKEAKVGSEYLPDECVSEDFVKGEYAWSATYHSAVIVERRITKQYRQAAIGLADFDYEKSYGTDCYAVYVLQKINSENTFFNSVETGGFNAYVPAYELGKLEHLKKYGIDLSRI